MSGILEFISAGKDSVFGTLGAAGTGREESVSGVMTAVSQYQI